MNMKRLIVILFILFAAIGGTASVAQAAITPVHTVDNLFTSLSQGQVEQALDAFDEDALATHSVRDRTYTGLDEIDSMLADWVHDDRTFEIVYLEMVDNQVTARVDIADQGQVWAQQTIVATVDQDGKLMMLRVPAFRLQLSRITR